MGNWQTMFMDGCFGMRLSARKSLLLVSLALGLGACATAPVDPVAREQFEAENDPLRPMNEAVFEFNLAVDKAVLRPVASAYRTVLPEGVRDSVRNFLRNLKTPVNMANSLLQGDLEGFGTHFGRFAFNTLAGFGGLFDAAADAGIPYREEDFGQTLAVWGVPEGPYLMLPILGPSNIRDTSGMVGDYFMDPLTYAADNSDTWIIEHNKIVRTVTEGVDARARNMDELRRLEEESGENFYTRIRSIYRQQRNAAIQNNQQSDLPVVQRSDGFGDDILSEQAPLPGPQAAAGIAAQ